MALAKDRTPNNSHMPAFVHQPYTFYGNSIGDFEEGNSSEKNGGGFDKNFAGSSNSSSLSSSSSATNSVISFKPGYNNFMQTSNGCLLSFDENDEQPYSILDQNQINGTSIDNLHLLENLKCIQTATSTINYGLMSRGSIKDGELELETFGWPNPQSPDHNIQQLGVQESSIHKRPHMGESTDQVYKKQCTNGATKKAKPKSTQSKDPQSIAAKNRRERISERLKVLQDLVPNGSKVDLVTMLEKAISYVKFLQLQVKVLATDEFWPVQGGKPPELSQVKEAIDAILSSSQRDRNSSSK